ncbi:MAG TPA: nuclear transport factor 2 family protein [Gaiellaceae bacterium]|nr:nuclear transport factor 2 family protein [Gaiellaceae bacterium]
MSQAAVDLLLRGYRAFVAGDLDAIGSMLDPDVEWVAAGGEATLVSRDVVLAVLADRVAEDYHVTVDRAIGIDDRVVVSMRFSRSEADPTDERPLQSRRTYLVGRYAAIVTARDGRVVRVEEHPHLAAALEAAGLEEDAL